MVLPRTKYRRSDLCTAALTLTPRGMRWSGMKNRTRHLSSASTELVPSPDTPHSDKKLCRLHTFQEAGQHDRNMAGYWGFEGNTVKISMIKTGEIEVIILHTLLYLSRAELSIWFSFSSSILYILILRRNSYFTVSTNAKPVRHQLMRIQVFHNDLQPPNWMACLSR